jgi:hypothetical protein
MLFNIRSTIERYRLPLKPQVYLPLVAGWIQSILSFAYICSMNTENIMRVIESKRLARKLHKTTLCSMAEISTTYYNDLLNGRYSGSFVVISSLLSALGYRLAVVDADIPLI